MPLVKVLRKEQRSGAAENVAANCSSMGAPTFVSVCKVAWKIRVFGRKQHITRLDFDHGPLNDDVKRMELQFYRLLPNVDIVIFIDYDKGSLKNVDKLIHKAKDSGKIVLVDPKGHDYSRYRGADVIKPNLDEIRIMVGGWSDEKQLESKVRLLMEECSIGAVLLTRASDGMTLYSKEGTFSINAETKDPLDVTGAGETAISAFAVSLARGNNYQESLKIANKAAGIVVQKFGTSIAYEKEVFS